MRILFVFLGDHGVALNMLSCLKGQEIYVIGAKKFCPLAFSRRCSYFYMRALKKNNVVEEINKYCKDYKIEILIPIDMSSTHLLNKNRKRLSVPVFPIDNEDKINLLENKFSFYEWLHEHSIQTPVTHLIKTSDQIDSLSLRFPVVVKPPDQYGNLGIKIIHTKDELISHLQSGLPYTSLPLIAQNYIEGDDVDVSVISQKGTIIAYTVQKWKEPRILEFIENEQALNFAKQIIQGLSFTGIAHFDMRVDSKNDVYVLECNPRFWGSVGASYMAGVNFVELGIRAALGKDILKTPRYMKDYYILMGNILHSFMTMKFKYFSRITLKSFGEVLLDPLPFVLTQLETTFKSLGIISR